MLSFLGAITLRWVSRPWGFVPGAVSDLNPTRLLFRIKGENGFFNLTAGVCFYRKVLEGVVKVGKQWWEAPMFPCSFTNVSESAWIMWFMKHYPVSISFYFTHLLCILCCDQCILCLEFWSWWWNLWILTLQKWRRLLSAAFKCLPCRWRCSSLLYEPPIFERPTNLFRFSRATLYKQKYILYWNIFCIKNILVKNKFW